MNNSTVRSIPDSERPDQVSQPFLRLLRHLDPRDLKPGDDLTPLSAVEKFKRRFIQRLQLNLRVAESIIHDALVEDRYSEPAARAEVARFARQLSRALQAFAEEADTNAAVAEEIDQAKAGLASIQPIQTGGVA